MDFMSPLGAHEAVAEESVIGAMQLLFRNYVAMSLLIESKIKSLMKPQIWLDIPFEELDKVLKDRLPKDVGDKLIEVTRNNQLSAKPSTYLPDNGTLTDAKTFAKVLAKVMLADKFGELKLPVYESSDLVVARMNKIKNSSLTPELQGPVGFRGEIEKMQLQEAEYAILDLDEETIVSRLVDERWMQCINDRAGFVSHDLLSRRSVQDESKHLAKIINERLETLPNVKQPRDVYDQDRHWHLFPLIQDLGTVVGHWERETLDNYIRANLYLFWAAADAWSIFPDDDSYKKSRDEARTIAEKLLRNYLVMVLSAKLTSNS